MMGNIEYEKRTAKEEAGFYFTELTCNNCMCDTELCIKQGTTTDEYMKQRRKLPIKCIYCKCALW